ncbi:UDP-glucose 4-epimerase family protein [Nitrosococcus watsonii]|uniref:NAD-dependent epimerase/dehydratase n=1 Tax=Nitrosococcus watsoni (strain C-113) TaxID=105559 RepID=D8K4G5_NITWC|nr:SDR family oxidoreductase [Nitrosococcus watsonii]ADJ27862.1 NAD-dependent epimerase/dehydratase [Nitrosococcus watsonii C-113]
MKVLVTGATGFIGRHLVAALLSRKKAIRILARNAEQAEAIWSPGSLEVVQGNLGNALTLGDLCEGIDIVFHLASGSFAENDKTGEAERLHQKVGVEGTKELLRRAVRAGVKRFIFVSSVKAMGEGGSSHLDEASPELPQTAYGRGKLAAERVVLEAGRTYGMHVCNLRLPMVYGSDGKGNLPRMMAAIERGWFPPLPEVKNRRSMVHVNDVVQALLLTAENPKASHQTYIVTDGCTYSSRQIYILLCQALGRSIPGWRFPAGLLRMIAKAGDFAGWVLKREVPLNSHVLYKLMGSAWYSCAKIQRELGYRPRYSLETALPEILKALCLATLHQRSLALTPDRREEGK